MFRRTTLDNGRSEERWHRWRPTIALCQQEDLLVTRLELLQQPAFTGIQAAYYTGGNGADYFNSYPPRVQPGDVILVHAGLYKDDRYRYGDRWRR